MKNCIILINIAFLSINAIAQDTDYLAYQNWLNEAYKQQYYKNDTLAAKAFERAFNTVAQGDEYGYLSAANYYYHHLGRKEEGYNYLRKRFLAGGIDTFENTYEMLLYKIPTRHQASDSIAAWIAESTKDINHTYKRSIDSLLYIDQCIIRKNCDEMQSFTVDTSQFDNIFQMDETNIQYLLQLIQQYGFPTVKTVGINTFNNLHLLFHHNLRKPENEKYIPQLKDEIKRSNYSGEHFAWMYDQLQEYKNQKPYYYYGVADISSLTNAEVEEIDARRRTIGVKPLEAFEITKTENGIMQTNKW